MPRSFCCVYHFKIDNANTQMINQTNQMRHARKWRCKNNHRNMDLIYRVQRLRNQNRETQLAKCPTVIHQDVMQLQIKKTTWRPWRSLTKKLEIDIMESPLYKAISACKAASSSSSGVFFTGRGCDGCLTAGVCTGAGGADVVGSRSWSSSSAPSNSSSSASSSSWYSSQNLL